MGLITDPDAKITRRGGWVKIKGSGLRTGRGFRQTDSSRRTEKENDCKRPDTFRIMHSREVSALCFHSFLITA